MLMEVFSNCCWKQSEKIFQLRSVHPDTQIKLLSNARRCHRTVVRQSIKRRRVRQPTLNSTAPGCKILKVSELEPNDSLVSSSSSSLCLKGNANRDFKFVQYLFDSVDNRSGELACPSRPVCTTFVIVRRRPANWCQLCEYSSRIVSVTLAVHADLKCTSSQFDESNRYT